MTGSALRAVRLAVFLGASAVAASPALAQSLNPLAGIEMNAYSAFTERPLFSQSRRPLNRMVMPAPPAVARVAPPPTVSGLRLIGTIQSARGTIARVQNAGGTQSVRSGETIEGWTVTEIAPSSISLAQGDHEASLELFVPGAGAPPADRSGSAAPASQPLPLGASPQAAPPPPRTTSGGAPPGTVAGTAAAEAAANAPFQPTFGGAPLSQ